MKTHIDHSYRILSIKSEPFAHFIELVNVEDHAVNTLKKKYQSYHKTNLFL